MNCITTIQYLDDFLDGSLARPKVQKIQSHIDGCESCRALLRQEQVLRAALRSLSVPELRPDFARSILNEARQRHERKATRWRTLGGAIAAVFALFVVANLFAPLALDTPATVPQVTLAKGQLREIKLVFNSKTNVDGATFTVQLPGNVALRGFPHQRSVSWKGRLKQGKNLLVLPVVAQGPVEGDLITWIEHEENKKAFHLGIRMEGGNLSRSSYRLVDMT
jgi:hypothetical protein